MKINFKIAFGILGLLLLVGIFVLGFLNSQMQTIYQANQSFSIIDRNNNIIFSQKNTKGNYAPYLDSVPDNFKNALLQKEDKYFYWHFGFNFLGISQVALNKIGLSQRQGSSTITQQLAKTILSKENQRTLSNKFKEAFYTLALETFNSKEKILQMYINSVYFGNQLQGLKSASYGYFNSNPENLTPEQINQLLLTINSPTNSNPSKDYQKNLSNFLDSNKPILELTSYLKSNITKDIKISIDNELNNKIREIVLQNIEILKTKKAKNASVIVLSLPSNQILSMIGSPDPSSNSDGYQINMAQVPRQIGSTVKPFIYLLGFEKGMRPYTLIDDREYKYSTEDGYSIYPTNSDNKYRGLITAHYGLSNSINTLAVKALEFVGLDNFTNFLIKKLNYTPPQAIGQYQIGIALGSLEMSLLDLAHYSSIFPKQGMLNELELFDDKNLNEIYFPYTNKEVSQKAYVELINKILSDRKTSIDQFGAKSDLNLQSQNYALKTGTTLDFRDSWIVGYTPDFLVAVWVGNADNSATDGVSGQIGAGKIWNQIMQLMLASNYNLNSKFDFKDIIEFLPRDKAGKNINNIQYGLIEDNFEYAQNIIINQDNELILNPHDNDVFAFDQNSKLFLQAKESVIWKIKSLESKTWQTIGTGTKVEFTPKEKGDYQITASSSKQSQTILVHFILQP